ncbi:hypothetical protein AB0I61_17210 [Polymorphospora rubra]|uniref:hypothetical protein n=1 Tax=Polymorphospora rubra TaxID=338584 RepID=UPI0033FDCCA7
MTQDTTGTVDPAIQAAAAKLRAYYRDLPADDAIAGLCLRLASKDHLAVQISDQLAQARADLAKAGGLGSRPSHTQDNVTQLLVTVEWHGNYYAPNERVDMLKSWIESGLGDRADSPAATITLLDERKNARLGSVPDRAQELERAVLDAARAWHAAWDDGGVDPGAQELADAVAVWVDAGPPPVAGREPQQPEPNDIEATGRCCCNGCVGHGRCAHDDRSEDGS